MDHSNHLSMHSSTPKGKNTKVTIICQHCGEEFEDIHSEGAIHSCPHCKYSTDWNYKIKS